MFPVKWSPSASADLVDWLFTHPNRVDEIDEAAEKIHEQLVHDPIGSGNHVSEGLWRIQSGPLAVLYSVDGNEVSIAAVHWLG